MEAYRFIVKPHGNKLEIVLPEGLVNQEIEVIVLPAAVVTAAKPEPTSQHYQNNTIPQYTQRPASKEEALQYLIGCLAD